MAARDILFLLKPDFSDHGKGPYFCPGCAQVLGMLEYYPRLKERMDIQYVEFLRPRPAVVELLGAENQSCPVLVLKRNPEGHAAGAHVRNSNGHFFVEGATDIANYLAQVHGIGIPH